MKANQDESLSSLRFTLGVLTKKMRRLPRGSAERIRCANEVLDINDKLYGLEAALYDGRE